MKLFLTFLILLLSSFMVRAQNQLYITANGKTMIATLEANASVEEFKELLPLTIRMSDYGGWEKVGDLAQSITRSDRQLTARPGDIMLYQGRSLVIFYGDNSWAYTPIGKIIDASATDIKSFLSGEPVDVTFSLSDSSGLDRVETDVNHLDEVYDAEGRKYRSSAHLPKGMYIINGKKTLIK